MAAVTKEQEQQLAELARCAASIAGPRWSERPLHPLLSLPEQLRLVAHRKGTDGQKALKPVDVQALLNLARQAQDVIDGKPAK